MRACTVYGGRTGSIKITAISTAAAIAIAAIFRALSALTKRSANICYGYLIGLISAVKVSGNIRQPFSLRTAERHGIAALGSKK